MTGSIPWLDRVRHQAEVLGNRVRAAELIHQARAAGADPELRFFLGEYERWLRLDAKDPGAGEGAVLALLLDVDHSGEGFVAWLSLEPRTELHPSPLPPGCGAAFAEAVERGGAALISTLWQRGLFSPATAMLADQRFVLRGPAAARHWVKDGGSIGAAAAVVLYSAWTGTALPPGIAITGGLDAGGSSCPWGGFWPRSGPCCGRGQRCGWWWCHGSAERGAPLLHPGGSRREPRTGARNAEMRCKIPGYGRWRLWSSCWSWSSAPGPWRRGQLGRWTSRGQCAWEWSSTKSGAASPSRPRCCRWRWRPSTRPGPEASRGLTNSRSCSRPGAWARP